MKQQILIAVGFAAILSISACHKAVSVAARLVEAASVRPAP